MDRSYRIAPAERSVVCDAVVDREDNAALGESLAWRREQIGRDGLEEASAVIELRALMSLDDLLTAARDTGPDATVMLKRDQASLLCQIAGAYVTDRDGAGYQSPEERDRIARLRGLAGPLMDLCCEFTAAEDEAREQLLSV
ncbi:MAG TPA: hypothetical protein VGR11_15185 [Solirubrobacteraceae bacterium]|nr:hypothetical protein [Solirubrobacteraceae bacterium]